MTRFFRCAALVLGAGLAGLGARGAAEEAKPAETQPRHGFRVAQPEFPALPGYYMLRMDNVQKELELAPAQIEKLKELGRKYNEEMRADQEAWKDWQKMTPEDRAAKVAEQREKYTKRAADLRKAVEAVLLPQQVKALKDINLRTSGPWALGNPRTQDSLGLSEDQKQRLQEIRQKMFDDVQEVQKKSFEKSLEVLTPEQREKLKEEVQKRGY